MSALARSEGLESATYSTSTLVIGSGLGGLALASDLDRRGISCIVLEGISPSVCASAPEPRTGQLPLLGPGGLSSAELADLNDATRQFRAYARQRQLDIRSGAQVESVTAGTAGQRPGHRGRTQRSRRWVVHTTSGTIMCDSIVLTRWARPQLRQLLQAAGISTGRNLIEAMRKIGIFLVHAGESISANHREVLRQVRSVSAALSSGTHSGAAPSSGALSSAGPPRGARSGTVSTRIGGQFARGPLSRGLLPGRARPGIVPC